jgi:hypothetical protein
MRSSHISTTKRSFVPECSSQLIDCVSERVLPAAWVIDTVVLSPPASAPNSFASHPGWKSVAVRCVVIVRVRFGGREGLRVRPAERLSAAVFEWTLHLRVDILKAIGRQSDHAAAGDKRIHV